MKTPEISQIPIGKTKFLEYSSAKKGQHFITIIRGKTVVGRIYRGFDPETNKPMYSAKDTQNNPIYTEEQTLGGLKKRFVQAEKEIQTPDQELMDSLEDATKAPLKVSQCNKSQEREDEMKKLRALNNNPEKQNEINR